MYSKSRMCSFNKYKQKNYAKYQYASELQSTFSYFVLGLLENILRLYLAISLINYNFLQFLLDHIIYRQCEN